MAEEQTNKENYQGNEGQENINPSQKRGIFKAIQDWFNKLGWGDNEITSIKDPNVLDSSGEQISDPFLERGIRTIASHNSNWRQADIDQEEEKSGYLARDNRYRDYKQMVTEPELESGVSTYADESTPLDDNGHVLKIISDNTKIKDMLERLLFKKLSIDRVAWDIIYEMCWMGDSFREILLDKETQKEILKLHRIRPEDIERVERQGKIEKFVHKGMDIEPFRIIHWRNKSVRFGNYGASIFESGRGVWKQLRLLEEAVLVYRVVRAPQRLVFYVDVGQIPPDKVDGAVERFKQRFQKRKMIDINTGRIDTVTNVMSYNENFYVPRVTNRTNSEISVLQQGTPGAGEIDDLAYFKDKLMALLKIHRDYASYGGGAGQGGSVTPQKYLSEQDIRFSRVIDRVQANFLDGLKKVCIMYLGLNGIAPQEAEQFEIKMTKSSALEELRRIEVQSNLFNLIGAIKGLNMFPDVWIMSKILKLDDDEISEIVHLMKVQAAQLQPEGMGGGGGGPFPGESAPSGGAIPPEVDQALQGAPGAEQPGVGPGAAQQMAAMLNAMENAVKTSQNAVNAKQNEGPTDEQSDDRSRDEIKRAILKKRISNKINAAGGMNRLREMAEEVKKAVDSYKGSTDGRIKLEEGILSDIVNESTNKSDKPNWMKILLNESADYEIKERGSDDDSILDMIEHYFGTLEGPKAIKEKTGSNNYVRELLMEGELKSLPKSDINIVQILKESMIQYKENREFNDSEVHMNGLLLTELQEQIKWAKKTRKNKRKQING